MANKVDLGKARNRLHPRLRFCNDEFIFDTVSGAFYRLSPVAGHVLKSLLAGHNDEEIVIGIERRYGVDRLTVLRDIELFFNSLLAEGLHDDKTRS